MHMNVFRLAAAALLIVPVSLIAAPVASFAPDTAAVSSVSSQPHPWTSRDIAQVTGKPFSAARTMKLETTGADGAAVTHEISSKVFRDSNGRVRQETQVILQPGGQPDPSNTAVQVYDPAARTVLVWTTKGRTATLIHLPPSTVASSPSGNAESLGSQAVNSIEAQGERTTQVVPAGAGYPSATVVTETWTASDLKVPMRQTISDPRHGTTTTELSDISQNEPDAALFQAPAGYPVRDLTPVAVTARAAQ
jgi:hypothetical protein